VLLIGAALLMESAAHLRRVDPGFNPQNLLALWISLPLSRYDTDQKKSGFHAEILRRVESLKLNERPIATLLNVTPGYFRTLESTFEAWNKPAGTLCFDTAPAPVRKSPRTASRRGVFEFPRPRASNFRQSRRQAMFQIWLKHWPPSETLKG
jgi:hypothetical protein